MSTALEPASDRVEALIGGDPGSGRRGFGSDALQIDGRTFAMLREGRLVLKLSEVRVAALLANGDGLAFDAGKERPINDSVVLDERMDEQWLLYAQGARAFVAESR